MVAAELGLGFRPEKAHNRASALIAASANLLRIAR